MGASPSRKSNKFANNGRFLEIRSKSLVSDDNQERRLRPDAPRKLGDLKLTKWIDLQRKEQQIMEKAQRVFRDYEIPQAQEIYEEVSSNLQTEQNKHRVSYHPTFIATILGSPRAPPRKVRLTQINPVPFPPLTSPSPSPSPSPTPSPTPPPSPKEEPKRPVKKPPWITNTARMRMQRGYKWRDENLKPTECKLQDLTEMESPNKILKKKTKTTKSKKNKTDKEKISPRLQRSNSNDTITSMSTSNGKSDQQNGKSDHGKRSLSRASSLGSVRTNTSLHKILYSRERISSVPVLDT